MSLDFGHDTFRQTFKPIKLKKEKPTACVKKNFFNIFTIASMWRL